MAFPKPIPTATENCHTIKDELGNCASFPIYEYSALTKGRTIRLLKSHVHTQPWPLSTRSTMNEFALEEYQLDDMNTSELDVSNSPYVAMSYTWGEPIFDAPLIIVDRGVRKVKLVTASAWEAIDRTVPAISVHGKSMWIDQICINQANEAEQGQQVSLMGDIYRRCWHCMIWLGPAEADTGAAFSLLRSLQNAIGHTQRISVDEREVADLSHDQIRAQLVSKYGRDILPPTTDPGWSGVVRLMQRNWFKRLWTFQEAVLCYKGDATICCGMFKTPVITFMRASIFLGNEHTFNGIDASIGRAALSQISIFRYYVENDKLTPLVWLLSNNSVRDCTKLVDRIYAFLGMRKEDGYEYPVPINYERRYEDVFIDTARDIIRSQQSLTICMDAAERIQSSNTPHLPSWVPDWTRKPLANAFERLNPSQAFFNSSNGRPHKDHTGDPRVLVAKGKKVDWIKSMIDAEVPDSVNEKKRQAVLLEGVLPELIRRLRPVVSSKNDAELAYTIINTITVGGFTRANNQGDSGLPPDAWSESACRRMLSSVMKEPSATDSQLHKSPSLWLHALTRQALQCVNRRFALLDKYPLGLVPLMSEVNDIIVILDGSSVPFILRKRGHSGYQLIGICFIDNIMHGEEAPSTSIESFMIC